MPPPKISGPHREKPAPIRCNRMLFDLKSDIAETKEVSVMHPETVEQLEALLNRYRDGGYSRELPPVPSKPTPPKADLTPLKGREAHGFAFE